MKLFEQLKKAVEDTEEDIVKFYDSSNAQAGKRVRKVMMDIKNLTAEIRKEIQEIKNKK